MVGLIDIAPSRERVQVRGSEIDVTGVSASGVASLFGRFPELRNAISGKEVGVESLMEMGGELVAAIIAAGTGALNDEKAEAVANTLSIDEQADLLLAIIRVTLPKGVGSFVGKLTGAGAALGVNDLGLEQAGEQATNSETPSSD
jgi:hypothetical protein